MIVSSYIPAGIFSKEVDKEELEWGIYRQADSLHLLSYHMRYKNLDPACKAAHAAYKLADGFPSLRAGALNNQGFCAFIHMDFEKAEDLFLRVYEESNNELECLIADIGMMKICQRTAMNKEFYDYRNSVQRLSGFFKEKSGGEDLYGDHEGRACIHGRSL